MKITEFRKLIREEVRNIINESKSTNTKNQPKNSSKKSLKEGYAWERSERKFGDPLPTLASIQAAHQAKHNITEEATSQLMSDPTVKSKVEMVIKTLQSIDVDGETMQYILEKVGMDEQMQHQLTPDGIR
jgi:hypothetical protein